MKKTNLPLKINKPANTGKNKSVVRADHKIKVTRHVIDHASVVRKMGKYFSGVREMESKNRYFDQKLPSINDRTIKLPAEVKTTKDFVAYAYAQKMLTDTEAKCLEMLRQEARSMFGTSNFSITMPYDIVPILSLITSGVVNSVRNVDASLSPEFGSVNLIFDEFRYGKTFAVTKGDYVGYGSGDSGNAALIANSMCVHAYDAVDNTALTSTNTGCQLKQHHLLRRYVGNAAYGAVNFFQAPDRHWTSESGEGTTNNNAGAMTVMAPRQWQATVIASALPVGYWKWYWVISSAVVTNVHAPISMFELEFRCRK